MQVDLVSGRKTGPRENAGKLIPFWIHRLVILLSGLMIFFSPVNPGRVSGMINENASLFTTAVSFDTITNIMGRALKKEWILSGDIRFLMRACAVVTIGILLSAVGGCMSLGNGRMKKRGVLFPLCGSAVIFLGLYLIKSAYDRIYAVAEAAGKLDTIKPMLP